MARLRKTAIRLLYDTSDKESKLTLQTWAQLPDLHKENLIKAFEAAVKDKIMIDLARCEENWAARHLLDEAWNNFRAKVNNCRVVDESEGNSDIPTSSDEQFR